MFLGIGLGIPQTALLGASSGPTAASRLAAALTYDATIENWAPWSSSSAAMSESREGTITQVTEGGPAGRLFGQKGARHLTAPADNQRPLFTNNALVWDGSLSSLARTISGLPSVIDIGFVYKGTDPSCIAVDNGNVNPFAFIWNSAATGSIATSGTAWVDGVQYTDRQALAAVMANNEYHRCELRGLSTSGWVTLAWQGRATLRGAGIMLPLWLLDPAQADYTEGLSANQAYGDSWAEGIPLGN